VLKKKKKKQGRCDLEGEGWCNLSEMMLLQLAGMDSFPHRSQTQLQVTSSTLEYPQRLRPTPNPNHTSCQSFVLFLKTRRAKVNLLGL
jgi:hypothetical protein